MDFDSLFTLNGPIDITPETLVNEIFQTDFRNLLNLAVKESFFLHFNEMFYIQLDVVSMGFHLRNLVVCNLRSESKGSLFHSGC